MRWRRRGPRLAGGNHVSHGLPWRPSMSRLAHAQVAAVIGADPKEVVFTSGATESNNLAIKGVAQFYREKKNHVITTQACRWRTVPFACPAVLPS